MKAVTQMFNFRLIIPDDVYQKVMYWINKSNHEVSGFGSLHYDPKNATFIVKDTILLKQEVAPTSTEIDPVALGKAMFEMREEENALKWHWHSHVDMGVFWSGDDRTLISNLGSQGWIVATVLNKRSEKKTAFCGIAETMGVSQEIFIDDVPTTVQRWLNADQCKIWDQEYADHVSIEKPKYQQSRWDKRNTRRAYKLKKNERKTKRDKNTDWQWGSDGLKWSYRFDRWVYNPVYDESLINNDAIAIAILDMDDEEIITAEQDYDKIKCDLFESIYDKHYGEEKKEVVIKPLGPIGSPEHRSKKEDDDYYTDYNEFLENFPMGSA